MSELLVIGFKDKYRAAEVLNELRRREWNWVIDLDHAVVIRMDERSKLRVLLNVDPTTFESATWARMWGSFLRLVLFMPVTNGLAAAAVEMCNWDSQEEEQFVKQASVVDVTWWRETIRIPEPFVRDVGALITPDHSALIVLLRTSEAATVLNRLRDYGGTLLHTSLSKEQDQQLMTVLS